MKIKSIYIASFGGVKDLKLDLNDNFTVIYGQNEQGKTTVMSFIKMMFYGSERSKGDLSKSPRKKYTPWDGSQMAGSIDFEKDGRNFRLERIFGESNSTDKITLIDLDLGKRESVSADIGIKILGLSAPAFERSIFIGQFGFPEGNTAAEGEINSKLSNIALTGSEDTSFNEVFTRLEKAKLQLSSKSGKTGIYDKNIIALKDLNERLNKSNEQQQKVQSGRKKAQETVDEIELLQRRADELKILLDKEQDFKNADKLRELLSLKAELQAITSQLTLENGQKIDEMFLKKIDFCLSKINAVKQKIENKENENKIIKQSLDLALNPSPEVTPERAETLENKIKALEKKRDGLKAEYADTEGQISEKSSPLCTVLLILGIILLIGGCAVCLYSLYTGAALSVLGVIGIIVSFVLKSGAKTKKEQLKGRLYDIKLQLNELLTVITMEKANLQAITTALNSNSAMVEKQKQLYESNLLEIKAFNDEKALLDNELSSLFGKTFDGLSGDMLSNTLESLKCCALKQKEVKQKINYILKDVGNISYEAAAQKIKEAEGFEIRSDFDEIKTEYNEIKDKITDRKTLTAEILTEIKALTKVMESPDSLKAQITELEAKTVSQKEYLNALTVAMNTLSESFAEVRRSYGSALDGKTAEIFKGITGGKYKSVSVSKSFDIAVEKTDSFGSHEIGYLSSGTADQAYLSLRLALSEFISDTNGPLPIMLDDSLAQFDDNRQKTAIRFLKDYSDKSQIIMFTCHKSVTDIAKTAGGKMLNLQ